MPTLLIRNIHTLATMDDTVGEISNAAILVRDNVIEWVGPQAAFKGTADRVLDAAKHVVIPGMVNTHHHMLQTMTRGFAADSELFGWLRTLYPLWAKLTPEGAYTGARTAMAELLLSGCTTAADHHYLYVNGITIDDDVRAAQELGMRFHGVRGAMTLGESKGGLPPDALVEDEAHVLAETRRAIEAHHDAARHAMIRIAVGPCSPFTVTPELMVESVKLARAYKVHLHTHLAENDNDVSFGLERYGKRPGEFAESLGLVGHDVWHAHCVKLDHGEIDLFARTGTGVAHCPCSNMRLASGIPPIRRMLDRGVKVGLGVDGSASNDAGHMLNEARQAMLLQRVNGDPAGMSAREALRVATRGGAAVLGRDDIGRIAPGMSADIVGWRLDTLAFAGAQADPVAALPLCASGNVDFSVINGRMVVEDGHLLTCDLPVLVETHNRLARGLL